MCSLRSHNSHVIVVVAKIPSIGVSKSRLIPSLGEENTLCIAKALLLDTLRNVSHIPGNQQRILYFAPASLEEQARSFVEQACAMDAQGRAICDQWEILPMPDSTSLSAHRLTDLLCYALDHVSQRGGRTCTFVGSDTPDLPVQEVLIGQSLASREVGPLSLAKRCYVVPAEDDGYVLLTLPLPLHAPALLPSPSSSLPPGSPHAPLFSSVQWSSPLTLASQVAALAAWGLLVHQGREVYTDMDEEEDLLALLERAGLYSSAPSAVNLSPAALEDMCEQFSFCAHSTGESDQGAPGEDVEEVSRFRFSAPPFCTLSALEDMSFGQR